MKWTQCSLFISVAFFAGSCSIGDFFSLKKEVDLTKLSYDERTTAMVMLSPESQFQLAQFFRVAPISNFSTGFNQTFDASKAFENYFIKGGDVKLWDMAAPAQVVTFTKTDTAYWLNYEAFPILEGHTYVLEANLPSRETIRAKTTIPRGVKNLVLDTIRVFSKSNDECLAVLEFDDPKEEKNYYIFGINLLTYIEESPPYPPSDPLYQSGGTDYDYAYYADSFLGGGLQNVATDALANGMRMRTTVYVDCGIFTSAKNFFDLQKGPPYPARHHFYALVDVRVLSVSEDYYEYYQFLEETGDDGPFFEPSIYPSNIAKGAIGIMSGFRVTRITEDIAPYIPRNWDRSPLEPVDVAK